MSIQDVGTQIEAQVNDVLSRLQSKQFFQSDWDIATFAIFFIFIGAVLFLLLLVLAQCCYGCCCGSSRSKERKMGHHNQGLEV